MVIFRYIEHTHYCIINVGGLQLVLASVKCNKNRSSINMWLHQLHYWPTMGLEYQWNWGFRRTTYLFAMWFKYVLIHQCNKWIELVAIPKKSCELVDVAFYYYVSVQFGAFHEVLIDQDKEFFDFLRSYVPTSLLIIVPHHAIILRGVIWLGMLFRQSNWVYASMDCFMKTTMIRALCSFGLQWVADAITMPIWCHISYFLVAGPILGIWKDESMSRPLVFLPN